MSDLMSIIKGRRSIRRYDEKEVPEEYIEQILESIRWSPSWNNTQCWEVILVKDRATKEKVHEIVPRINPAYKAIACAPVLLALCGKLKTSGYYQGQPTTKFGDWFMFDLGIATQSLCLTAHSLGLGTVIVGLFDHNKAKEVLGLGEDYEVPVIIPIGYPAKDSPVPKRREIGAFTHYDEF